MQVNYDNLVNESAAVTPADFVTAAREYLGVRYHPQARSDAGMDCGGLLLGTGRDLQYTDLEVLGYANSPDGESFAELLESCLDEVPKSETAIGDIVACDFGRGIQHTAIVTRLEPKLTVIHATRKHGVCEQFLYGPYLKGWVKTYRLRNLTT